MKSRKKFIQKQSLKRAENCRLPAANRPDYAPLTARLRLPFTLPAQEARCAVFAPAHGLAIIALKNARFCPQEAHRRVLGEE